MLKSLFPVSLRFALPTGFAFCLVGACNYGSVGRTDGSCVLDSSPDLHCDTSFIGQTGLALGLVGYTCTGAARPDENATYLEGVPRGLVCGERGAHGDGQGYCCTQDETECALNPVAICEAPYFGFQCRGPHRPDALNAALGCTQGVREGDYTDYCCSTIPQKDGCVNQNTFPCAQGLDGWSCTGNALPRGEELGANESRADGYYLLCPTATPGASVGLSAAQNLYCCYPPPPLMAGASCVQAVHAGCAPGRFGFACYGPDTPPEVYPPMVCPEPAFSGMSDEGYPAELYCCDFAPQSQE
jgi:hypothetical protein